MNLLFAYLWLLGSGLLVVSESFAFESVKSRNAGDTRLHFSKNILDGATCFELKLVAKNAKPSQLTSNYWSLLIEDVRGNRIPVKLKDAPGAPKERLVYAPYGYYYETENQLAGCLEDAKNSELHSALFYPPHRDVRDGFRILLD